MFCNSLQERVLVISSTENLGDSALKASSNDSGAVLRFFGEIVSMLSLSTSPKNKKFMISKLQNTITSAVHVTVPFET